MKANILSSHRMTLANLIMSQLQINEVKHIHSSFEPDLPTPNSICGLIPDITGISGDSFLLIDLVDPTAEDGSQYSAKPADAADQ